MNAVTVAWKNTPKTQPAGVKFVVPSTDAPNVNGARDVGFAVGQGNGHDADTSALRTAVTSGRVKALYVVDPGPDGSLGDLSWIVTARRGGSLPLLVVQGVVMSELAAAADIVLPGAAWVEKDGIYTNDQGKVQGASQAIAPPGEAMEGWQILATLGRLLGLTVHTRQPAMCERLSRRHCQRRTPTPTRCPSLDRFRLATGCRLPIRRNAGSGISSTRISRP